MPIADPAWPENFECSVQLEVFKQGSHFNIFVVPLQQSLIFYRMRMYLWQENEPEPELVLNHETSQAGSFLGLHDSEGHKNLGPADPTMSFSAFVDWAMQTSESYLTKKSTPT